jgi:hypothetical protein
MLMSSDGWPRVEAANRAAVVPRIADRHPVLDPAVQKAAEEAVGEIARFDARTGADLTPAAAILLRTVSASSSRIEQLTSGARAIAVAELGGPSTRHAEAVVGNAELRAIRAGWQDTVRARADAGAWRVADLLLRQPVLDSPLVSRELGVPPQNAVRVLAPLIEAGVLTEFTGQKRNRMWQAREVLDALDAFATRAGRRSVG